MTREAVSAAKPAVRVQAKTGKVHGAASAAVLKGLVYGAAMLTFAVLLFLLGYILVTGIPHLKPSLFQWNYTSENVSMMPAILATVETTALALLLAVPLGLFTAVYLNEYAKRGNKLVNVIRITTETLSGIPSIVYGLFGMLFFVTRLHWGYSLLAGAMTLAIMILPLIMRTAEEALIAVPDSYREGSVWAPDVCARYSASCCLLRVPAFCPVLSLVSDASSARPRRSSLPQALWPRFPVCSSPAVRWLSTCMCSRVRRCT